MNTAALSLIDPSMTTSLAAPTPLGEIAAIIAEHYKIDVAADRLGSERDEIFALRTPGGDRYIAKITNPAEDASVTDLQTKALLHIAARAPDIPVPRVIPTREGEDGIAVRFADGASREVRLISFLDGAQLSGLPATPTIRRSLGDVLARLGLALSDFSHPGANRNVGWDLRQAGRLKPLVENELGKEWEFPRRILFDFEDRTLPAMLRMRAQIVHNDLNAHNVLVAGLPGTRVSGVLDFGDMVHTAIANDLAICACYQFSTHGHALEGPGDVIGAYHRIRPLEDIEIDMMFDLICTRLAMAVAITEWRARRYPQNRAYILKNTGTAWAGLRRLSAIGRDEATRYFRQICSNSNT